MEWSRGEVLGRGSSATVSLATYRQSGETFAVKSAEVGRAEALQREQRILSRLSNPHVVGYRGAGVSREGGGLLYNIFMEYAGGGTLADVIRRRGGRLDEATIACYAGQIVTGLDYLHSIGLAHCDVKGKNILVGEFGVKIGDLGSARWIDSPEKAVPITGTPAFMAPEVARGEQQGLPADVWALGCTILEMATGGSPWPGSDDGPLPLLYKIGFSGESPEIPSFLSEQARGFLSKCLRRDPRERWTANQLLQHPFLKESVRSGDGKMERPDSNSPTTVLDMDFWEESGDVAGKVETRSSESAAGRVRRLAAVSGMAGWTWDGDWIATRSFKR